MDEQRTSPVARILAVGGLMIAAVLIIAVIATTHGGGGSTSTTDEVAPGVTSTGPDLEKPAVSKALNDGFWIVKTGDTLDSIAIATGIDIIKLQQLNPNIDPEALPTGAKVKLR